MKVNCVARVWARFMSLSPYDVKFPKHLEPYVEEADRPAYMAEFMWKQGVVPGEWLIRKIQDSCEWMPAPVVAREMYCAGGWQPVDGVMPSDLPAAGRRRESLRPAELEYHHGGYEVEA